MSEDDVKFVKVIRQDLGRLGLLGKYIGPINRSGVYREGIAITASRKPPIISSIQVINLNQNRGMILFR